MYQAQPAWHVCQAQHALMLAQPLALRLPVVKTLALVLPPLCLKARCAFPGVGYPNSPSRWDFVHSQAQCFASKYRASTATAELQQKDMLVLEGLHHQHGTLVQT